MVISLSGLIFSIPWGSVIVDKGSIDVEVDRRIASASNCANLFLMTAICPSKLRDVCIRLVCCQPFCMEVNVGHLSVAT